MNRPSRTEVVYRDRRTGKVVTEKVLSEKMLRWFYETPFGLRLFKSALNNPLVCRSYGTWHDLGLSRPKIQRFIDLFNLNLDEVELPVANYRNFNAFFSRKLKTGARPFSPEPNVLCSPADGKVLVYPAFDRDTWIPVKGNAVNVEALLASNEKARNYYGGSALVVRLAPYDYHRFHFPDTGTTGAAQSIRGEYHSVNPIALMREPDIFVKNKRAITVLKSLNFGSIAYVEVGAFSVASIVQTYLPGPINRGDEKGYFQFGGSTLVLLFEPGAVKFDDDLLRDSKDGLEVHLLTGSQIGRKG